MVKSSEFIKGKNLKPDSETTSSVASLSYEIEDFWNSEGKVSSVSDRIDYLKEQDKFPSNLEYKDSFEDKEHGVGVVVFKDKNTGKSIIGIPGTNLNDETDGGKDKVMNETEGYNILEKSELPDGEYYGKVNKFVKEATKKYDVETITGHSLGGRGAMLLGANNDIPNIVTYNTAPIYAKGFRKVLPPLAVSNAGAKPSLKSTFTSIGTYFDNNINSEINDIKLYALFNNYDEKITRISSNKDPLTNISKFADTFMPGKIFKVNNNKGHSMEGFLRGKGQKIIKPLTYNIKGAKDANTKNYKNTLKSTKSNLKNIDKLEANMIQTSGGLTSSSKQVLKDMVAFSLASGLHASVNSEINNLKEIYHDFKESFNDTWEQARTSAAEEGKDLNNGEQLSALHMGGAFKGKIVDTPHGKIDRKISKLNSINKDLEDYIDKVKDSVNSMVEKDQQLSNQIGGKI
ncbi:hypothetical protein NW130_05690 [Staphylococcus pettenkoferi]|uniref:hypothetical protein n=1 Tax=Staphylococcus pettenkoferi TaxID=170573 RepID=UPI0022728375|nr:hypothetical protein [Staphylococcus pettenkoferi]MCY1615604.1 hypothetical protein [Staphylococcus pettenkoferi]